MQLYNNCNKKIVVINKMQLVPISVISEQKCFHFCYVTSTKEFLAGILTSYLH